MPDKRFADADGGPMKAAAAESRTLSGAWKLRTAGCGDALQ